jgi:hypothetical protein
VYYGTDTRAQEILIGAALAMVWPSRRLSRNVTLGARRVIDAGGVLGLAVIALMFWRSGEYSTFLYRGGFLVLGVATVLLIAALVHPASRLGPVVGCRPMRWIGERSYGIYLWHFPIIVLTTPAGSHAADPVRALFQVAATIAIAALSWKYIEDPIRHGAIARLVAQARAGGWRRQRVTPLRRAAFAGIGLVCIAAVAGLAGVGDDPSKANQVGQLTVDKTVTASDVASKSKTNPCTSVIHIGDSTSEGLVSADYLPNPKQRITAQYRRIGAKTQHLEISGARSIYETYEGAPSAYDVALDWKNRGFHGCWVLALGTNEAANVAAGSNYGLDQRIDRMMSVIGHQPVLWVNVRSLVTSGPYAESNMRLWNAELLKACARYPDMRIYDWASDVKDSWFIPDGIHFTTPGYAARARLIADALKDAFESPEQSDTADSGCVVDPEKGGATAASPLSAQAAATPQG